MAPAPAVRAARLPPPVAADLQAEERVMHALRALVEREEPTLARARKGWQTNWDGHHCAWTGVTCRDGHVQMLIVPSESIGAVGPVDAYDSGGSGGSAGAPSGNGGTSGDGGSGGGGAAPAGWEGAPPEVVALSTLRHLIQLLIGWSGRPWGVPLPVEWLQPGVFPNLTWLSISLAASTRTTLPEIPPGALHALRSLELRLPGLLSTLPASWGANAAVLPSLTQLSVLCEVRGGLPPEWATGFPLLQSLSIARSPGQALVQGDWGSDPTQGLWSLPPEWGGGRFPQLQSLYLSWLGMTGSLPASWQLPGSFPVLYQLGLFGTGLSGTLPAGLFAALPSLEFVGLDYNRFTGTLPAEWVTDQVQSISVRHNNLSGPAFPPAWLAPGSLPHMGGLLLGDNPGLTGTLPAVLPWKTLGTLALSGTGVSGTIPAAWCSGPTKLKFLQSLFIGNTSVDPTPPPCAASTHMQVFLGSSTAKLLRRYHAGSLLPPGEGFEHLASLGGAAAALLLCTLCAVLAATARRAGTRRRAVAPACQLSALSDRGNASADPSSENMPLMAAISSHKSTSGSGSGSTPYATSATRATSAGPQLPSMVRLARPQRLQALLSAAAQANASRRLAVDVFEKQQGAAEAAHHGMGLPPAGGIAGASSSAEAVPGMPPDTTAFHQGSGVHPGDAAGAAASGAPPASLAWALPTQSLRLPVTALELVAGSDGELVELGSGRCGTVLLAKLHPGGRRVAVKALELEAGASSDAVWRELTLLRQCQHPHVLAVLGAAVHGSLLMIVTELMEGGSLQAALKDPARRQRLRWGDRGWRIALDIAEAVDHLHTQLKVFHSDLKPGNILLSGDLRACVADLGLSQALGTGGLRTAAGWTKRFAAPEQLMGMRCGLPADIYSLGMVLAALLTLDQGGKHAGWRLPHAPQECPQAVAELVQQCLAAEPQHRPTASQVFERLRGAAAAAGLGS